MKKRLFEIYLTQEYVEGKDWLELILKVSKINGILKPWNLWIYIENNYIRYFIEINRVIPPVIGELGSFLFKNSNINLREKSILNIPYILTSNCKTVLDVYDRIESKRNQKLKYVKITIYPHKSNTYFSTTKLYLKTEENEIIRRKVHFNFSVYDFVSINFGIHTRFFYQKDNARYLETKKVINLLNSNKEKALLKADVFPYLQEELYLKHTDYEFAKHSVVIGASRHRKI